MAEAFALKSGESLSYEATLTGKITSVDYAYNATSGDITVSISVEGKTLKCYRMTGGGIAQIKVGDTITVKGKIKNYNGTIEFDKPVLTAVNNGANTSPGTADFSMTGLFIVMAMATTGLVVLSKKKFYI
ncbi:MAG: OB-fold nucleic acid binding domain-containing protein [Bacteroidales bacterium]|nr:OB-fold nucleic acid binding domain-containing protein [Bacteroidales bacterium]